MSRLKIVIFFVAVALAGACVSGAYWLYTRVIGHDTIVRTEIKQIEADKKNLPDPGAHRFDKAVETIKEQGVEAGRDALYDLLRHFPDSNRAPEAKRIVGEMNLDMLFSASQNSSRRDYTVQPGDSPTLIARKNATTVDCLMRANGMISSVLHPGDHLFVFPLDFEIKVSVGAKTLTILRNGRFFKEYTALDVRLPPGMKVAPPATPPAASAQSGGPAPKAVPAKQETAKTSKSGKRHHASAPQSPPGELTINDKAAWFEGKRVIFTDPRYNAADKWFMGSKAGFNIRALPAPKPAAVSTAGKTTTARISSKPGKPPKGGKAGGKRSIEPVAEDDTEDATAALPETGVFLAREDIEELFTIIRTGTKVTVLK